MPDPEERDNTHPPYEAVQDERTPLLTNSARDPAAATAAVASDGLSEEDCGARASGRHDDRPLPVAQVLLLCYARAVEPIACFSIFPFVNQMVQDNGNIAQTEVGYYSGLIESLFSLTQMMVMIFWGRAADRFGRKPVLVVSLIGITFTTTLFGFASTITQMIVFRSLAGIFAGTVVTLRAMINEHSTAKTQARAFSWFAFSSNLGIFFGPLIGGALAEPAKQYGGFFSDVWLFNEYPYALPTLVTGTFAASATIVVIFYVKETLPDSSKQTQNERMSILELLRAPGVPDVLFLYSNAMLLGFAFTAVSTVFYYTSIEHGGLGFRELYISLFMGLVGFAQSVWLLLFFPPLQRRFGTVGVLRGCSYYYPFFFATFPMFNLMLRQGTEAGRIAFWILAPTLLVIGVGISMAFTAVQLALNDISPSPQTLGTLNALALALTSGLRAIAPFGFSSIFAIGVDGQILSGYLVWAVLMFFTVTLIVAVHRLPKKAEGRIIEDNAE